MEKYIKPTADISQFEVEELIMVSNMNINDLNNDLAGVKYYSVISFDSYKIHFGITIIVNCCSTV